MNIYNRAIATTLRMLTKYGRTVTLRPYSVASSDYNPSTGQGAPAGEDGSFDTIRRALETDQPGTQISQRFGDTLQNGTLVQSNDKWLYMDAVGAEPHLQDHILMDNINYMIINVQTTKPSGLAVFYLLVLRA